MADRTMNVPDQSSEPTTALPMALGDRIREAARVMRAMGVSEEEIAAKLSQSTAILPAAITGR